MPTNSFYSNENTNDLVTAHLQLAKKFSDKLYLKWQTSIKLDVATMPSLVQMRYYFSNSDAITCPITGASSVNPVKLIYVDGSCSKQVFDGSVIARIIKEKGICPITRQEVQDYISTYTPLFVEEFNKVATKNICKQSDILDSDKRVVAEFIDNYLILNLDPDDIVVNGCSLLYTAAKFGLADHVKKLLDKGMSPNQTQGFSQQSDFHFTPLCVAACLNHVDVVRELLSHQTNAADVNATPDDGVFTDVAPAYFAARFGHVETMKELVLFKANLRDRAVCQGISALYMAILKDDTAMVSEMLKSDSLDIDFLQTRKGDDEGLSALYLAVSNGNVEIAKQLLAKGADVLQKQGEGKFKDRTVFDIKLRDDEVELKELLVKAKATRAALTSLVQQPVQVRPMSRLLTSIKPVQGRVRPGSVISRRGPGTAWR